MTITSLTTFKNAFKDTKTEYNHACVAGPSASCLALSNITFVDQNRVPVMLKTFMFVPKLDKFCSFMSELPCNTCI